MDEPVRLVCPQCDLVYRLKRITPGRDYTCKKCGAPLEGASGGEAPALAPSASGGGSLARLAERLDGLTERLDAVLLENGADGSVRDEVALGLLEGIRAIEDEVRTVNRELNRKFAELDGRMAEMLGEKLGELSLGLAGRVEAVDTKVMARVGERLKDLAVDLESRITGLDGRVAGLGSIRDDVREARDEIREARNDVREVRDAVGERLAEQAARQSAETESLIAPLREMAANTTVEVNVEDLAERLVAGIRGRGAFQEPDSHSALEAMARLADELVKEQSANTARLDVLAEAIKTATEGVNKLEEWRGELPERVADEIGQTVEARVVGPISGALARQAPAILSELQDSKLVDIVSRSVREAQRPLLREILAGGRNGVPVWLFASILLPLLLILGYLFLPGDLIGGGTADSRNGAAEAVARLETLGVPLTPETEDRLLGIEEAVLDLHNEALVHVRNAATFEEEVKNLRTRLDERDRMIAEYEETVGKQTRRLQAYEMRLVQLGVSPAAVAGQ